MKRWVQLTSHYTDKLSRHVMIVFLILAFIFTIYQVFSRYVLQSSFILELFPQLKLSSLNFPWLEELIRYLFIWIVFLGISVVYKMKGHAQVEIVTNFLPAKWKHGFALVVEVLNSIFFIILFVKGLDMLNVTNGQLSPSLQINMAWMYISILCCAFICFIHSFATLLEGLTFNANKVQEVREYT